MSVTVRGPFFASDVDGMIRNAIDAAVKETTEFGASAVQGQLYSGHGVRSGKFRASITGRLLKSGVGTVAPRRQAIKGRWLEGTSRRNQTTRFKGYGVFRIGRDRTDNQAQKIADRIFHNLTQRLN